MRHNHNIWKYQSLEWSTKIANNNNNNVVNQLLLQNKLNNNNNSRISHFVLPDLPKDVISSTDINEFYKMIPNKKNRIRTVATCNFHNHQSFIEYLDNNNIITTTTKKENHDDNRHVDKILLVGGNQKNSNSFLTTEEAAKIIHDKYPTIINNNNGNNNNNNNNNNLLEIWGVTNPNDKSSPSYVNDKIDAGITGFITQPLLSSHAYEVLDSYPRRQSQCYYNSDSTSTIEYVAGLAFPTSTNSLQFWLKLLGQPELINDPLFCDHYHFFENIVDDKNKKVEYNNEIEQENTSSSSSSSLTSFHWVKQQYNKLHEIAISSSTSSTNSSFSSNGIDGVHFMPLHNINDLMLLLK